MSLTNHLRQKNRYELEQEVAQIRDFGALSMKCEFTNVYCQPAKWECFPPKSRSVQFLQLEVTIEPVDNNRRLKSIFWSSMLQTTCDPPTARLSLPSAS